MKEALLNYKTDGMTTTIASTIVEIVKKSKLLTFPQDEKGLEEICKNLLEYLNINSLTQTAIFEELNKKINNFNVIGKLPLDHELRLTNFEHMKTMLDLHAPLIALKYDIPYLFNIRK